MDITEEVAALTRDLAAVPSHEDETAAGDRIEAWLREETDARVTRDDGPGGGNVVARAGSGGPTLALVGHHDVVPPDDSQLDGEEYRIEERDGRLYGRGTADMKGAVAAMLCAFRDALEAGPDRELVFASFAGEEQGGLGAAHAIEEGFAPDYALVGEGTTNYRDADVTDVAVAHKGRRGSTLTARGTAAHASEPEAGENAVYRACDAVGVVRDLETPEAEVLGHHLAGSVVVTEIEGGSAWNVVPEECTVTVDERTVPGEYADLSRAEAIEGVEWTVDQDLLPMRCDDERYADGVLDAAREVQSGTPEHIVKPQATDAGRLSGAGTTCLVCGPAELGEPHTADESVSLAALERVYRLYRAVAGAWPDTVRE